MHKSYFYNITFLLIVLRTEMSQVVEQWSINGMYFQPVFYNFSIFYAELCPLWSRFYGWLSEMHYKNTRNGGFCFMLMRSLS